MHVVLPDVLTTSGGFILNSHLITTRFGRPSRFSMLVRCWLQLALPFQGILAFLPHTLVYSFLVNLIPPSWFWLCAVSLCDELAPASRYGLTVPTLHISHSLSGCIVSCECLLLRATELLRHAV
jgi:hypothetical protein